MNDEDLVRPLEERLADDARRLLDDSARPPITILRAEFMRRRRRSALAKTVCTVAVVIAVAFVAINLKRQPPLDRRLVRTLAGQSNQPSTEVLEFNLPQDADTSRPPVADIEGGLLPAMAIAILFPAGGDGSNPEFVPGWYVPEQIEVLRADDLSPAERSAAARLLGLEAEISDDEII